MTINTTTPGKPVKYSPASPSAGLIVGICTVPVQPWEEPYDAATALKRGTIFPSLDLPFFATGGEK